MNSRIVNRPEFEKLSSNIFSVNGGYLIEHHHFIINGDFVLGNSFTGDADKRSSRLILLAAGFNVGYNFSRNEKIRFYPFTGITGNSYFAKFNKDISGISFDSVLQSNAVQQRTEPVKFTNSFFCYNAGIGLDFIRSRTKYLRSIGIKASYTGSFSRRNWRANETQLLQNAPSDNVSQFNFSLLLGIGRVVKRV